MATVSDCSHLGVGRLLYLMWEVFAEYKTKLGLLMKSVAQCSIIGRCPGSYHTSVVPHKANFTGGVI